MVSLSARDRQALEEIEEELGGSDPRFAAKLSAFSRLTDDGEMPARERIRAGRRRAAGRALLFPVGGERPRRSVFMWISVTIWLVISAALLSVALVLSHTAGTASCAQWKGLLCVHRVVPSAPASHTGHSSSPVP